MKKIAIQFLIIALLGILFFSCNNSDSSQSSSPDLSEYSDVITSYTGGFISSQSDIKVVLTSKVEGVETGVPVQDKIIRFVPELEGQTFWEDEQTIVFKPSEGLVSGKKYNAVLLLNKIIDSDKGEFPFSFECIPQNYEVNIDGITLYDARDLTKVKISGILQTSDVATADQVEAILTAKQNGNPLAVTYEHGLGSNKHQFVIENIVRGDNASLVEVSWDGASLELDKTGNTSVPIPSLSDYSITSVQIVRGNPDYVSVKFSDPINPDQNMRGAVWFSKGNNPRVVIELNELKVYPTSILNGKVDIGISRLVKNVAGYDLKDDYKTSLTFSSLAPQIRQAANSGTIMPSSEGLIVPFEAVSLNSVDLTVVEIFQNNIIQYLQEHDFGKGDYWSLRTVARPVARKVISLNSTGAVDLGDWNRFTVDLAKYIDVKPGALYQVRLNFRRGYSLYACTEEVNQIEFLNDPEFESTLSWDDSYDNQYYYDWENRDNPCHQAYYSRNRMVSKIVYASDFGIIAKKGDEGELNVFVTDLNSLETLGEVKVTVFDYQQQIIGTGSTNQEGKAIIDLDGSPFAVTATKDETVGYLKINDGSALSVSNFNVTGNKIRKGIKGFIYGERGVWRPADTLHLAFILEDAHKRLPEKHPVILELFNPLGQLFSRKVEVNSTGGIYSFKIITKKDSPTGNWLAKVKVGGAEFYKQCKIETVKPNRLKLNLEFPDDLLSAENPSHNAQLEVKWLHGAVAKNLKANYEVILAETTTKFKGFENYNFDDPRKKFDSETKVIFDGRLDNQGSSSFSFKLGDAKGAPGMLNAIFKGKAFEEGGDFSINKTTIPFAPFKSFVGLVLPNNDRWGRLTADTDHIISIATLDSRGKPVDRSSLKVEVFKIRWRWWWDNSYNRSSYSSRYQTEKIKTGSAYTTEGKGSYKLRLDKDWGRYYVKISDTESGHSTGKIFYLTYPGWANQVRGQLGGVTMLDLSVDKDEINVGEELEISFPSSSGSKALISIENGSSVVSTNWVNTADGETITKIPITASMAPNIFVNVSLLQPHAQTKNSLPIRLYGIQGVEVVDPETILEPQIVMPDELKPGQRFSVKIKESNSKDMAYTIAIVEDGLLDLTQFRTPDPWRTFFAREALGVKTWDIYDDVMGSYGGQIEKLLAIGGDDEIKGPDEDEANRFKPVVMYKGPYFLEGGKEQSLTFTMPEYIGSVRAMVIAGYNNRFGKTEKTIPVKQPLMVLATLPRVAGPSEEITLPVNIFSMSKEIKDVEVNIETEGKLEIVGSKKSKVAFEDQGDQLTFFTLKASPNIGRAKVIVTASSGELNSKFEVALNVRAANPALTQVEESVLQPDKNWDIQYNPLGLSSTNEASLELSSLPPLNLDQRMKYLIRYPHGCVEQTTSSVFAQLFLSSIVELSEENQAVIQKNVNAGIKRLRQFQLSSGAFSYWPGNSQPSYWGTNYAGHFLIEARNRGYLVPEDMINKWIEFQQVESNGWDFERYNDYLTQSYRLYTLSRAGNPALGAMNRMRENSEISYRAKWSLASAYANIGQESVANKIIEGLGMDVKTYREMGGTFGSTERDLAIMLETMIKLNRETDSFELVKRIASFMSNNNRWMSTQTIAYCLIAISEYAEKYPPSEGVNVKVNVANNDFRVDGSKYMNQVTLINPDSPASVKVVNNGSSPIFVKLIRHGVPIEGQEEASNSNLRLQVRYENSSGISIDPSTLEQGTEFFAKVTVTNPGNRGDYDNIALTQVFPSGWEIINSRLDDTEDLLENDKSDYKDIRDDRVMTYFDLDASRSLTFTVRLNAAYRGKFYLPAVFAEAMYDNSIAANTEGRWIEVSAQK